MAEDMDDPDIRAGQLEHELLSVIGSIANEFNYGNAWRFDEADLIVAVSKIGALIDYKRLHRLVA